MKLISLKYLSALTTLTIRNLEMSITLQSLIARNLEIITNEIDDELVMMSVEEGKYFGLNAIGASIWEQLEEPKTIESIVNILLDKFEVNQEQCEKESLDFISEMIKKNVILVQE